MTDPLSRRFAQLVPKADLHCHLTGSIALTDAQRIGSQYLTNTELDELSAAYDSTAGHDVDTKRRMFFHALNLVVRILRTPADLSAAVAAVSARGAAEANLRYLEMSVNPSAFYRMGLSYPAILEGLREGADISLRDSGVMVRYIVSFLRDGPLQDAWTVVRDLQRWPSDYVLGVGLDGPEDQPDFYAGRFRDVYTYAGQLGLRRTAHIAEAPSSEYWACVNDLGCDRIDHGYPVLDDPEAVDDARRRSIPFTVCPTLTADMFGGSDSRWPDPSQHPIVAMHAAGLRLSIGTDDGGVVQTDIGQEYAVVSEWMDWGAADLAAAALSSLDAAWLDDHARARLKTEFTSEIDDLTVQMRATCTPQGAAPRTDPDWRPA